MMWFEIKVEGAKESSAVAILVEKTAHSNFC